MSSHKIVFSLLFLNELINAYLKDFLVLISYTVLMVDITHIDKGFLETLKNFLNCKEILRLKFVDLLAFRRDLFSRSQTAATQLNPMVGARPGTPVPTRPTPSG